MSKTSWGNLGHAPSNEEFEELRQQIAALDERLAREREGMAGHLLWLVSVIESDPDRIRKALGLPARPPANLCPTCGLSPCGCERRWRP